MNQQTTTYQGMVAILPPGCPTDFRDGAFFALGVLNAELSLTNGIAIVDRTVSTRRTKRSTAVKEPSANTTSGKILTAIKNRPGITSAELQIETGLNAQQIGTALGGVSGSLVTKKLVIGDAMKGWNLAQSPGATSIQTGQRRRGRRPAQKAAGGQAAEARTGTGG